MNPSTFFERAANLIHNETQKLEQFCAALDKNPIEKKQRIAEYKCAKYRYAGATNVWCRFFHSHRVAGQNAKTHYLIPQLNEMFIAMPEYVAFYDNAPDEEKRDYALYYGTLAFADAEIAESEAKLPHADDWQKIELEERISGLKLAKDCLSEAWQKRKDVAK